MVIVRQEDRHHCFVIVIDSLLVIVKLTVHRCFVSFMSEVLRADMSYLVLYDHMFCKHMHLLVESTRNAACQGHYVC